MTAIEDRLRRLEDQFAISQLRARYCHLLDDRKWTEFVALFTKDGAFSGLESVRGHAALLEFFTRFGQATPDFWHFCTNETVNLDGDTATGRVTLEYLSAADGISYVSAGHYDDVMQRVDGEWKFKSRTITFYYLSPLSQGWAGRPFPGRQAVTA